MGSYENRAWYLRRRPQTGLPTTDDLELVKEPVRALTDGEALVRVHYLSMDPTVRIWMSDRDSYMPPSPLDEVMRGVGVGQVVESRSPHLPVGTYVAGMPGMQEYCVADGTVMFMPLPDPLPAPPSAFLGVLGLSGGFTSWVGVEIIDPKPGETVVVTAAAGSTGSIAGQIAKARGARAVGVAGGPEKCAVVVKELGFDACVDYKAPGWRDELAAATPNGIDGVFENVGGPVFDGILTRLNLGARVALCGMISQYEAYDGSDETNWPPQYHLMQLVHHRASITGFLCLDHMHRMEEGLGYLAGLLAEGKLTYKETVVEGIDNFLSAFGLLYSGGNIGKTVLRVADPDL